MEQQRAPAISFALWIAGGLILVVSGIVIALCVVFTLEGTTFTSGDQEVLVSAIAGLPVSFVLIAIGSIVSKLLAIELHLRELRAQKDG